jgi:hypothetical protein
MLLYKYQIKRFDSNISIGDDVFPIDNTDNPSGIPVKIVSIIKIDTDEMILYFLGVTVTSLDEEYR